MSAVVLDGERYECSKDAKHLVRIVSTPLGRSVRCEECNVAVLPSSCFMSSESKPVGRKFDDGKLRYDLVDPFALAWLVSTLTYGATKYAAYNYRNFTKEELREKYYAGMMRHLEAFRMGQNDDPETGIPHVAMMSFGAMVLTETFAPRDLGEIIKRTKEAIRRWREIEASK